MPAWFQDILDFITRYWFFLSIVAGTLLLILISSLLLNARSRIRKTEKEPDPPTPAPEIVEAEIVNPDPVFAAPASPANPPVETPVVPEPESVPPADIPAPLPQTSAPQAEPEPEPAPTEVPPIPVPPQETVPKEPKKILGKYHVMYRASDDRWYVKREGSTQILRVLETQREAQSWAIIKALPNDIGIVVHEKDGKIKKSQPL